MKCEMKKDVLERWLDEELDGEAAVHVDAHVKECNLCSQHVAQTLQVRQALRDSTALQVAQASFDSLWSRIEERLEQTESRRESLEKANAPFSMGDWWTGLFRPLAAGAAVAALGITIGLWTVQTPLSSNPALQPETVNHAFVMESYEVSNGTVVIDVDPQGSEPAVVWHFIEEEEEQI